MASFANNVPLSGQHNLSYQSIYDVRIYVSLAKSKSEEIWRVT